MFTQALLVGLVLFGVWFVEKCLTTPMVFRPLVVGTLVGIALGDPVMGAKCGAMLGAGIGTALAIITGKGPEVAFTLGFPIAVFGQSIKIVCFIVRSWYMGLACKYAREVQVGKMHALNWFGLILQCTIYGLVGFCTIYFGSSVVENVLNNIPEVVMTSSRIRFIVTTYDDFKELIILLLRIHYGCIRISKCISRYCFWCCSCVYRSI